MKTLIILLLLCCVVVSAEAQLESSNSIVWSKNALMLQRNDLNQLQIPQFPIGGNERYLVADPTLPARLQTALDVKYAKTSIRSKHGVSASVIVPGMPQWDGSAGESHPGVPMNGALQFEIASNTKTMFATLILKLQEEGKLSISDPLHHWLPQYPNIDSNITIKQLLNHSSGIFDYLNDDKTGAVVTDMYFGNPGKHWTAEEILLNYVGTANFKAGTSYRYSNTNFLLLGMIAEKADGIEPGKDLRTRFFDPLQLTHTYAGWRDSVPNPYAHNWLDVDQAPNPFTDLGEINKTAQLTGSHSAGGVVSTPHDLARWAKNLYEGHILSKASLASMLKMNTWPGGGTYGLGAFSVPYYTRTLYGHNGHLPGFLTDMFNMPSDSVTLVVYLNTEEIVNDVTLNDYVVALLDEIYRPVNEVSSNPVVQLTASAYPNPAADKIVLTYELPFASNVSITVYDMLGRGVVHSNTTQSVGKQAVTLDLHTLPQGSYIYRIESEAGMISGRMQVVR